MVRAVLYCRCSTEEESQVNALQNQVREGEACIASLGWFLVDEYIETKSGTTTQGRDEYNRLYDDLLTDRFDIIVIKSQDRLMRNVKDWYLFLDKMLSHGKRLYFYLEKKFYSADDALITGIKAILAEEYSRELSKKINNAHHNRQINGGKVMITSRVFGFNKLPDGRVEVLEEEAKIVRQIYEYCLAGYGSRTIANIFRNRGYVKKTGGEFTGTSVLRLLRNPIYKGTMCMNRRHFDFETKKEIRLPKDQWIYQENAVPAIVDEETWKRANAIIDERAERYHRNGRHVKGEGCRSGKYDLTGKLICSQCGQPYYRVHRRDYANREKFVVEWKCSTYLKQGREKVNRRDKLRHVTKEFEKGCDNVHLDEEILISVLEKVSEQYFHHSSEFKNSVTEHAISILRKVLQEKKGDNKLNLIEKEENKLQRQKDVLLSKLLDGIISDQDYQKRNGQMEKRLAEIREQKEQLKQNEWEVADLEYRIDKIRNRLENGGIEKATVSQMLQEISVIRVHEWQLEICFDPIKMINMSGRDWKQGQLSEKGFGSDLSIWVDYPFAAETQRGRYLLRRKVVEQLRQNPSIPIRKVAEILGESPYLVRNRVGELINGGYIRFNGKGGRGQWEILKELPDIAESFEIGGL